ncbi:MAG: PAS domain S-box protein [Myxococcales bacterium]|nr:PAS domain S-box protein [Myxococcales bacterium]
MTARAASESDLVVEGEGAELESLRREVRQLRALIEHGRDLLILLDAEARIIYASPSMVRVMGYTPREVVGEIGLRFVVPEEVERVAAMIAEVIASPGTSRLYNLRLQHKSGAPLDVEAIGTSRLQDPAIGAIVVTISDLTDQKRREAALQTSERRLQLLASRAHDIIARHRLKPRPQLEYISPAVERITGYPVAAFHEDPELHMQLLHPEDRVRYQRLMQGPPESLSEPITLRWTHRDGHTIWIEQRLVPELDANGQLVATESISRDVSSQIRLEQELRRAQKLEAVGRLAAGVAHDFNNLLGVTLLCAERLEASLKGDSRYVQWVSMILDSTRKGSELTQRLLAFARTEATREASADVPRVVRELQPMIARVLPEDIRLNVVLADGPLSVGVGRGELDQTLMNLVVNARDAMPRGGRLHIEVLLDTLSDAPQRVVLCVRDSGVGLSEEQQHRIFEPFFTTKNEGSGLGLAVVYGIVQRSGGRIQVESSPGIGSTFTLSWPRLDAPLKSDSPGAVPVAGGSETVLLVEDSDPLRRLASEMLGARGYTVLEAATAAEAERIADTQAVDLLLADVVLPDASGPELAVKLAARDPDLRVLYTSGHAADEVARRGTSKRSVALLPKPYSEEELVRSVQTALAEPRGD